MKQSKWLTVALLLLVLLTAAKCCEAPYKNPPSTFQDSNLAGTWETHYSKHNVDRLILKADGTFKQIYQDDSVKGYIYETPWNEWWVERFGDGRIRVHLKGARYYIAGIRIAEEDGTLSPCPTDQPYCLNAFDLLPFPFYDPFAEESIDMVGELVLNIRTDSSGELVLHHMWTSSDRGFAMIGGGKEVFRRIETP